MSSIGTRYSVQTTPPRRESSILAGAFGLLRGTAMMFVILIALVRVAIHTGSRTFRTVLNVSPSLDGLEKKTHPRAGFPPPLSHLSTRTPPSALAQTSL